ncbi:MAG: hypothetical protein DRJ98_00055 [Thermoprotei archaeon]|nr:MAG: hypothetical protein DRJ98_00055 [Thermoprotei archaeon]RLF18453.1 MAG: hypothetical protein DRN06_01515 [Thermoprotei archaeon]
MRKEAAINSAGGLENDVEERILQFLRSRKRGATMRFIAVKVGDNLDLVASALNRLLTRDAIEKRGKFFRFKGRRRWSAPRVAKSYIV